MGGSKMDIERTDILIQARAQVQCSEVLIVVLLRACYIWVLV
jgi:hypothetical protein